MVVHSSESEGSDAFITPQMLNQPIWSPLEFNDALMNSRDALPDNWEMTNDSELPIWSRCKRNDALMNWIDPWPDNREMTNEFQLPIWSQFECNYTPMNWGNPLPDYSEIQTEKIEVSHISGGLTNFQTNQNQLIQVETSEASCQTKPGRGRVELTPNQKKESKRQSDYRYRQKLKRTAAEQTAEINHLKRKNEELNAEVKMFKKLLKCPGQLPAEAPWGQKQDTCIAQSTSMQLDHPSDSVQVATVSGLEMDLQNLHQKIPINAVAHVAENLTGTCYDNTTIKHLMKEIDEDVTSKVRSSDFPGLDGECIKIGKYNFPLSLCPVVERIIDIYGDVSAASKMNLDAVEATYILFCASVKEMGDLQLEEVSMDRILKWGYTIKDALRINFNVDFAMDHLKKIAHAYIGRIESQELKNMTERISKLEADLTSRKEELAKRKELSKTYMDAAEEFNGKSLSLFT